MTKLEIMNLIKEEMNKAKYSLDYNLEIKGEEHGSTLMAHSSYYTLKWLLMDIQEKELLEKCDEQTKEVKELLNNENNF